jgi:SAM-dependent methyltransferase
MTQSFREYAPYYDLLYHDKDYSAEARYIGRLLERFVGQPAAEKEILDLACGTGRHVQELARLGYPVEGSDLSAEMIEAARERAKRAGVSVRFYNESFQSSDRIGRKYHAVIAMFAAINYLTDYRDLARSLANIRGLLREGGVFVFDFWNGNSVLREYSPVRVKRAEQGDHSIIRISKTSLDSIAQIASVEFNFILLHSGKIVREFSEIHRIRYFFPQEMQDLLTANGFEVLHRCPFLKEQDAIGPDAWNLTYVVRPCV